MCIDTVRHILSVVFFELIFETIYFHKPATARALARLQAFFELPSLV
jgi:hypothetical protein